MNSISYRYKLTSLILLIWSLLLWGIYALLSLVPRLVTSLVTRVASVAPNEINTTLPQLFDPALLLTAGQGIANIYPALLSGAYYVLWLLWGVGIPVIIFLISIINAKK